MLGKSLTMDGCLAFVQGTQEIRDLASASSESNLKGAGSVGFGGKGTGRGLEKKESSVRDVEGIEEVGMETKGWGRRTRPRKLFHLLSII